MKLHNPTSPTKIDAVIDDEAIVALHAVPTADATTDANIRDVVGRKTDAAVYTVGTTKSIVAYLKGILTFVLNALGFPVVKTISLNQAAASYDLYTGTGQTVELESLRIKMPTGAAGGALTSISIQTDDATAQVLISSTNGVVANLTSEAELAWVGSCTIAVGKKIQLTIGGGAHGSAYTATVRARYKADVAGGYLD